ncbi:MAG: hypothetical protein AAF805_08835 [Planctomycetota bacterium]
MTPTTNPASAAIAEDAATAATAATPGVGVSRPGGTRRTTAIAWASLVLSPDETRLRQLADATQIAGWEPIPCLSAAEAMRLSQRWRTQLATIDLSGLTDGRRDTHRQLASQLVTHDRLVVVCDDAATPDGELWARQAGVWLYLPKVDPGEGLVSVFRDALGIAEKLATAD